MRTSLALAVTVLAIAILFSNAESNFVGNSGSKGIPCEDGNLLGKHETCMGGSRFMKWKCECQWPFACDYSPLHKSYVCMGEEDYDSDFKDTLKRFIF
ncbi:uncharacterized protein LOC100370100 isoform X2 [Saccoglossus kowalevskii]